MKTKTRGVRSVLLMVALLGAAAELRSEKTDTKTDVSPAVAGAAPAESRAEAGPRVIEARGRVLVREEHGARYRGRAKSGMVLRERETLLSGPGARVELTFADGAGRWRVGQQAAWSAGETEGDAVLRSGTALVAVPRGRVVRVEGVGAAVRLGEGVWLLTAVANNGFKLVALDHGVAWREPLGLAVDDQGVELRLRAGELVFAPPGEARFGSIITVFLDELLATSRLVGGFSAELPQAERLRLLGAAQRESIKHVSNAFVGGARDAAGFQIFVPKTPIPPEGEDVRPVK